jgi:hypothetical protein
MRYTNTGGELPLLPLSGGVTIALWLYYTNSPSETVFSISSFGATTNATDTGKILCYVPPTSAAIRFNFAATTGGVTQAFQRTIPNSWNHYVISFITGGKIIFYLNGVQQADNVDVPSSWGGTDSKSYRFGGNVGLGCTEGAATAVTGMTFSDWRFYNTVLTPVQIQSIYQSGGYYLASQMSMTGAPLLKLLSAQAQSSAAGLFSLRAVREVTARAVNVMPGNVTFPSAFMTYGGGVSSSTQTLGGSSFARGSYTVTVSQVGDFGHDGTRSFQGPGLTNQVTSGYSGSTGLYSGPTTTAGYAGEYVQLYLPRPLWLTAYTIASETYGGASNTKLFGSNDTSTWILLDSRSSTGTFTVTVTSFYSYFRIVMSSGAASGSPPVCRPGIGGVQFIGQVPITNFLATG